MNLFVLPTRPPPVPIGRGIVNACPHCWTPVVIDGEDDEPSGFCVCDSCGEVFTHQPHPGGRICARFSRAWFLSVTCEEHRRDMRRIQEDVWRKLGQFG